MARIRIETADTWRKACGLARTAGLLVILLLTTPPTLAAPGDGVATHPFFTQAKTRLTAIGKMPPTARPAGCAAHVEAAFDLAAISRGVAGEGWSALPGPARNGLEAAVLARLARECVQLLKRTDAVEAALVRVRSVEGGMRLTATYRGADGQQGTLLWSIRKGGALGWKAIDLVVDGRGLMTTLRGDFESALLATGGDAARAVDHFARMILR